LGASAPQHPFEQSDKLKFVCISGCPVLQWETETAAGLPAPVFLLRGCCLYALVGLDGSPAPFHRPMKKEGTV
jgi:hypothetical protein